jgi:hypothetical protein
MAITRCSEELSISWYDKPSRYVTTLQKNI